MRSNMSGNKPWAFLLIAVVLMVFVEFVVMRGDRPYYHDEVPPGQENVVEETAPVAPALDVEIPMPRAEMGESYGLNVGEEAALLPPQDEISEAAPAVPLWRENAVAAPEIPAGFARVVIIIDDLGVDRRRSQETIELPGPLTAAFLPYAGGVADMAAEARENGHELIIHMPMEPGDAKLDLGEIALRTGMAAVDFDAMLTRGMAAFDGYVGMNNHMGSKLTSDKEAMRRVMARLKREGMLFIDSRTIATSIAGDMAAEYGVPHEVRDVFLDHDPRPEAVKAALADVERVAHEYGTAIAIGHPKDATIAALREWLPTLAEKKIVLVPVSAVVTVPEEMQHSPEDSSPATVSISQENETQPPAGEPIILDLELP